MNQKGFTLIELLVAMFVGGILLVGLVTSIFQVSWGTIRTRDQIVPLTDINFVVLSLKKDLPVAETTSLTDGNPVPQSSVTLNWSDYTGWATSPGETHSIIYALSGTNLLRTYDGAVSIVGRNITSIGFTQSQRIINVVITATGPGTTHRNETLKFTVKMRPEVSP